MSKPNVTVMALLCGVLILSLGWAEPSHADCAYTTTALSPGVAAAENSALRRRGLPRT